MSNPDPADLPPTIASLKAEIETLKVLLSGAVTPAERDKLQAEIADLREELRQMKNQPSPPTPPRAGRWSDHFIT